MYNEYNGYNAYTPPPPPPKKSGGNAWKIIVAVAASVLVFALVICTTAVFVTWIKNFYSSRGDGELATEATSSSLDMYNPDQTKPAETSSSPVTATERPAPGEVQTDTTVSGDLLSASDIYYQNVDAVVSILVNGTTRTSWGEYPFTATGSGFIISSDGYIITCYHVVEGGQTFTITLFDGSEYEASYVGGDEVYDTAVLKIDGENLTAVALGDSDNIVVGEDVVVIGNPLELTFSVTKGIISATDRIIDVDESDSISVFQLDAAVNSGNSGGPVFNDRGEVIGMVDAKYAAEGVEGLGFALPINQVLNISDDLIAYGYVTGRPYFGISVSTARVERGYAVNGARIENIDAASCAARAGLKIGDIITGIDGRTVESASDLVSEKDNYRAGDTAVLTVWRNGEALSMTIVFDEAK